MGPFLGPRFAKHLMGRERSRCSSSSSDDHGPKDVQGVLHGSPLCAISTLDVALAAVTPRSESIARVNDHKVLVLGGGVAGVIAARTLHQAGITDFLVVEARSELGGRLQSSPLSSGLTIELGANWIEGLQSSMSRSSLFNHFGVSLGRVNSKCTQLAPPRTGKEARQSDMGARSEA